MAGSEDLLYSLAAELRNHVYGELFFSNGGETIKVDCREQKGLAILGTSRLYHHEASSYFYSRGHFVFTSALKATNYSSILSPIPDTYVHYLKRVTLSLRTGHTSLTEVQEAANMISALTKTGAAFKEVTIEISQAEGLSSFMNARCDDSIMDIEHCMTAALEDLFQAQNSEIIRIILTKAWFGPAVATYLKSVFDTSCTTAQRLYFFQRSTANLVTDLSKCERELRHRLYHDPLDLTALMGIDSEAEGDSIGSPDTLASAFDLDMDTRTQEWLEDNEDLEEMNLGDEAGVDDSLSLGDEDHYYQLFTHLMPDLL